MAHALNITPTELARRAQVAQTTINRFLSGKSVNKNLSGSTIYSISSVVYRAARSGNINILDKPRSENVKKLICAGMIDFVQAEKGNALATFQLSGYVGHGIKVELVENQGFNITIPVSNPLFNIRPRAFELREEDNARFQNGSIIVCMSDKDFFSKSLISEMSILIITNGEGLLYSLIQDANNRWWLIPLWSDAPADAQIHLGDDAMAGFSTVRGDVFLVVASIRPETQGWP